MFKFNCTKKSALQTGKVLTFGLGMILLASQLGTTGAHGKTEAVQAWPPQFLDIGMSELPSRPSMFQVPDGTRYRQQYLAGGAKYGWSIWNNNGDFAKFYIESSQSYGKTSIFTFYNICQSGSGGGGNGNHPCYQNEQNAIKNNLENADTMRDYWNDLELFYKKAAEFPNETVILHVEPDLWGHIQQLSSNDDSAQYPNSVMVSGSGHPSLGGLPNSMAGFAQALFRLRDTTNADNVLIAYHASPWGTGDSFIYSNPNNAKLIATADQSIKFYKSLNQIFDLTFFEMRDRDAGFYQYVWNTPDAWWNPNDFDNHIKFINRYTESTGQQVMIWQIPYGNTKRAILNNTTSHYQDNLVETLLDEPNLETLKRYKDAGVIALIFGQGAGGTTCPCDSNNDGKVDDGGYFYEVASNYIKNNLLSLSGVPSLNASYSLKPDGIKLSWNSTGASEYEIWWGASANLAPGSNCAAASNCASTTNLSYTSTLPNNVSERYFVVAFRENGELSEVSAVFRSVRLTEFIYLPMIANE
ncbi:MAG: hypothetical protein ACI9EW_003198 [Cellvibrionaceae bacterium]|jgi:hypothetical protein